MAENASLRESLVMMQKELVAVLNEKSAELSLVRTPGSEMGLLQCTSFSTHFYLCWVSLNGACYLVAVSLPLPPLPSPLFPPPLPLPSPSLVKIQQWIIRPPQPANQNRMSYSAADISKCHITSLEMVRGGEGEGCVYV